MRGVERTDFRRCVDELVAERTLDIVKLVGEREEVFFHLLVETGGHEERVWV